MHITYRTKKLKKICTNYAEAVKVHNTDMAILIHQRIKEITSASSIELLIQFKIGRCHELKGDRKGEFSMHLKEPYRLIFKKGEDNTCYVECVHIINIEDYH